MDTLSGEKMGRLIQAVNQQFGTGFSAVDFGGSNDVAQVKAALIQKLSSNQGKDWTAEQAQSQVRSILAQVSGKSESSITEETLLNDLIPSAGRKEKVKQMEAKLGFPMDILKPNSALYGFFILVFFLGIPGMWYSIYFSSIIMIVCAVVIYILGKTGNEFKVKTVGHLADHLFWNKYLKNASTMQLRSTEDITSKLDQILGAL